MIEQLHFKRQISVMLKPEFRTWTWQPGYLSSGREFPPVSSAGLNPNVVLESWRKN